MHDHIEDLRSTTRAVVSAHLAADSVPNASLDLSLWNELEKLGFIGLGADESLDGSGGDLLDAATVLSALGTSRVPYAESTFIAAPSLSDFGLRLPGGPFTSAEASLSVSGGRLSGRALRVPFARDCESVVLIDTGGRPSLHVVALGGVGVGIDRGVNMAGEARDTVTLDGVEPVASAAISDHGVAQWRLRAALARAVSSAGLADTVVEATLRHVRERQQFGRPLMSFQTVQHSVARMAADATAMQVAATAAVTAMCDNSASCEPLVVAAKAETALLTRPLTAAAHQAHGAIGFTQEHSLGALTTRLWAWREEHGNERFWQARLGSLVVTGDLWALVTGQQSSEVKPPTLDKEHA